MYIVCVSGMKTTVDESHVFVRFGVENVGVGVLVREKRVETGQRKTDKRGDRIIDGHSVNDAVPMCSVSVKAAVDCGIKVTATKSPACPEHNLSY